MKLRYAFIVSLLAAVALCALNLHAVTIVPAGGDLQAAINAAVSGDTIVLTGGATYTGNFTLPAKNNAARITIMSSTGIPPEGVRVTPATAVPLAKVKAGSGGPALLALTNAKHYAIVGIEFLPSTPKADGSYFTDVIDFGDPNPTTLVGLAEDLLIDRCYIHGADAGGQRRGVALNAGNSTVRDSHISGFRDHNGDSQAVQMSNGPGPYWLWNNYLEAASEPILIGGSDPLIVGLVPGQAGGITIQKNTVAKSDEWKPGTGWNLKNLIELKNAKNVLIEGNVFAHSRRDAQSGWGLLYTVRNQDGKCTWCTIKDVETRYNIISDTDGAGIAVDGSDYRPGFPSVPGSNLYTHDNLLIDTGDAFWFDRPFVPSMVSHNSVAGKNGRPAALLRLNEPWPNPSRLTYQNNITPEGVFGVTGNSSCTNGTGCFLVQAPGGVFTTNVVERGGGYPYAGMNYTLPAGTLPIRYSSDYHYSGTEPSNDGLPIGADIDTINAWTAGLVVPVPPVTPVPPTPVPPIASTPYKSPVMSATVTIQAEDFDNGGEGVAYHDLTPLNEGGFYRISDGVDLQPTSDSGGGYNVGWVGAGEWLQYTTSLPAGTYTLTVRVACLGAGGTFHVEENGKNLTGAMTVPNTGNWQKWTTLTKLLGALDAGLHTFRVVMDTSGPNAVGNFNWFMLAGAQK